MLFTQKKETYQTQYTGKFQTSISVFARAKNLEIYNSLLARLDY